MRGQATLLAALVLAVSTAVPASALATAPTTLPHIKGAKYCGEVYKPDDYSLYGYVESVGCSTEKRFVKRCEAKSGLQGWKLTISSRYGFLLRKDSATIELQIAGGSPRCIADAATT